MKLRESFIIHLIKYGNIPYLWGGKYISHGLDCSGLVWNIFNELKIASPTPINAQALYDFYKPNSVDVMTNCEDLGDLIFFGSVGKIHHVGLCLNSSLMLEAAYGGTAIDTIEKAKQKGAKVQVSALNRLSDRFAVIRPADLPWLMR